MTFNVTGYPGTTNAGGITLVSVGRGANCGRLRFLTGNHIF
jgi:hypothetical protein